MTREEAIQFLDNMKHEEAGRAIGKDGFYAELMGYHVEALNMAIKALERMAPPDCESVTSKERTEDEEVIALPKGTLKAVTGRFVVYDREWLKKHFNTTEAYLYGINAGDLISRQAAKSKAVYSTERHEKVVPVAELDWLPSVEPERKTGKWIRGEAYPHRIYCSECYKTFIPNDEMRAWVDGDLPRKYCPECGARMEVDG